MIAASKASVDRSRSVSSIRMTNWPLEWRASSQLKKAIQAPPTWRYPVGLGAYRVRTWPVADCVTLPG